MKVSLTRSARRELIEAAAYYFSFSGDELAVALIDEFERSVQLLERHPRLGAPWFHRFRRLPLRRFPYTIGYRITATEIRVLAVAHDRRDPKYWIDRS